MAKAIELGLKMPRPFSPIQEAKKNFEFVRQRLFRTIKLWA